MRVLIPEWNILNNAAQKFKPQHLSLSKHCDVSLLHCNTDHLYWIKDEIVQQMKGKTLNDYITYADYVHDKIGDFDVLYTRNGGQLRQFMDLTIARACNAVAIMKIGGVGKEIRDASISDTLNKTTLLGYDALIPLSESIPPRMPYIPPTKFTKAVPLGIDKTTPSSPDLGEIVYGYAGRHSPEKGLEFLRSVIKESHVKMHSVGHMEMPIIFPSSWEYEEPIQYETMDKWYDRISVGVLPSYSEVCPNFLLECYMHARPIIAAENAIPPELPIFGAVLPQDKNKWIDVMKKFENPYELGLKARNWMMDNWPSWDDFGKNLYQVMQTSHNTYAQSHVKH